MDFYIDTKEKTDISMMDSQNINVLKEGWLQKQSKYLQQYRKRWVVIYFSGWLYSYKKAKEYKDHTESVDLKTLNNNECVKESRNNKHEFVINVDASSVYRFIAQNEHDRNEWISTIDRWLSFRKDIVIYSKKWQQIIYDRTLKKMQFESSLARDIETCCISLHECQCAKRIVFVLKFYDIWCAKQIKMQWFGISIESILKHEFGVFNVIQLINDIIHLIKCHFQKNKSLSAMFFIDKLNKCHQNKLKCTKYLRNNRDRRKTNNKYLEIYFGSASNTIIMQILDAFHCFVLHSEKKKEAEQKYDDDDDEIILLLQQNQNDKNRRINNKFTTYINSIDNNCSYCNVFGDDFSYYISPKFSSLKEEMLQNKVYSLTPYEWNVVTQKAMKYKLSLFGVSLTANTVNIWNKRTKIEPQEAISMSHILCLLLNTNYCQLSLLFKGEIVNNRFVHFYRLLFEAVYLFGDVMSHNEYYYHNIASSASALALFSSFRLNFKSPVSCTTHLHSIYNKDTSGNTLTLKLHSISNGVMPYFDVSYLTDYIHESEVLLFRISLNIAHIYYDNVNVLMNNNQCMLSFKLFISMSDGDFFSHCKDLIALSTQKSLIKMLSNPKQCKSHENYLQNLFNHYLKNRKEFWINDNELEKLDKTLNSLYFSHLHCKNNSHLIIKKIQLFSWHIESNNVNENINKTLNGPTLLYTLNSFQIAFDSMMININSDCSTIYFGVSSQPTDVKWVKVSFCLYCEQQKFYAQIHENKMSLYHYDNVDVVKRVGCKCFNYDCNKLMTFKIAVKITNIVYN